MSSVVVARGLRFAYGRHAVIHDLDLVVPSGIIGLLGPNGAGKSTLFNMFATLSRPSGGSLTVLGRDVTRSTDVRGLRAQLGYLPQGFGYPSAFTVREFVEYAAWLKRVPARQMPARVQSAISAVDLDSQANTKLRKLSGGMLQRAGIAHALVHQPHLLILDEPTVGLDPQQRVDFRRLLRHIGQEASVVVSTHLVEDVAAVCDHVLVLDQGRVAFSGAAEELGALAPAGPSEGLSPLERGYSAALHGRALDRTR
jgi:ABC-2 type transport system ATP-binding protein